jgi:TRAP-type C4-dicarboxylate transport system substrate-binding protein
VPAPKVYETLASNAADGVVMPFESRKGFKLTEVAQNVFEVPGGLYRGSFAYIMNEDAFAELPAELQQALEKKVFGEPLSRELGKIWDQIDAIGRETTLATADNAINTASDTDLAAYQDIQKEVIASVLKEIDGKGIDAQAAYDMVVDVMSSN